MHPPHSVTAKVIHVNVSMSCHALDFQSRKQFLLHSDSNNIFLYITTSHCWHDNDDKYLMLFNSLPVACIVACMSRERGKRATDGGEEGKKKSESTVRAPGNSSLNFRYSTFYHFD